MSILHRVTGIGLAVGTLLLAYWLIAAAAGPEAFATGAAADRLVVRPPAAVRLVLRAVLSPLQRHPASGLGCRLGVRVGHHGRDRLVRDLRLGAADPGGLGTGLYGHGVDAMSLRTPIARARGLGSAKEGTASLVGAAGQRRGPHPPHHLVRRLGRRAGRRRPCGGAAWIGNPVVAVLMVLLVSAALYHAQLGMQVVYEDYIILHWLKIAADVGTKLLIAGAWRRDDLRRSQDRPWRVAEHARRIRRPGL